LHQRKSPFAMAAFRRPRKPAGPTPTATGVSAHEGGAPGRRAAHHAQLYQRLIRKVVGKPEERIISYLMLRSLKQARYAAEPLGHFASLR